MNLPNIITIIRILLMPFYLYIFYSDKENSLLYAGIIFIIAGLTDALDGYIARNYNMKTDLGALLDPLADKIVVFTILVTFTHKKIIPIWILLAMGIKEISLIIGGAILYLSDKKIVIPSNRQGKISTILFYISIASYVLRLPENISISLLSLTLVSNLLAFINYLGAFLNIRKEI